MRHHFPTQADLRDAVLGRIGDWMSPGATMEDAEVPARERLRGSLHQVLDHVGTGQLARDHMTRLTSTLIDVEQTAQVREAYLAVEADGLRRIERWLDALAQEGHLASADVPRSARFLGTVINGLALQRALPAPDASPHLEAEVLDDAIAQVLRPAPTDRGGAGASSTSSGKGRSS
jgi:AcrR family transcriptional regulator